MITRVNYRLSPSGIRVLLQAMDRLLTEGRHWLQMRIVPDGHVASHRSFTYFGKPTWGLWSAQVPKRVVQTILDHVFAAAVQPNGDLFFREEAEAERRLYRALYCLLVAAAAEHPLARHPRILSRLEQYQHERTGAIFNYIGDDPREPRPDPFYAALLTSTGVHVLLRLGWRERAMRAGEYLARMVEANRISMEGDGIFYTQTDVNGQLITAVPANRSWCYAVSNAKPKQEFWQIGAIMAALAKLSGALLDDPAADQALARRLLDAAFDLLRFEATMLPEGYEWPQKCKLAWGGGELLQTCLRHRLADDSQLALLYRVTRRTVVNTFLDAQLPDGSWAGDHYPLSDDAPEMDYDYRLLRGGLANAPREPTGSATCVWFTPEEMTGEFLGEMAIAAEGIRQLLSQLET